VQLKLAILVSLTLLLVFTMPRLTYADSSEFEVIIDWPCYKPTKITFNYAYTHNHSISDITTVGASLYKHTGGPTFIEFIAEDIDTYTFRVTLSYRNETSQSILVGLWSGTQPLKGLTLKAASETFIIHVRLAVMEEPSYPTESEVAEEVVHQIEQSLVQQQDENRRLLEEVQVATVTANIFGVIAASASTIALLLAGFSYRRRRVDTD